MTAEPLRPFVPKDFEMPPPERPGFRRVKVGKQWKWLPIPKNPLYKIHLVPYRDGGEFTVENLRAACARCNSSRGAPS